MNLSDSTSLITLYRALPLRVNTWLYTNQSFGLPLLLRTFIGTLIKKLFASLNPIFYYGF